MYKTDQEVNQPNTGFWVELLYYLGGMEPTNLTYSKN